MRSTSWRSRLALGVHHLRTLTGSGLDVDAAARQLEFRFAAAPDQFLTMAKLRAARRTWHRVASVSGVADTRQRQHAVTSRAATSRYDTWVNVLRNTVACFAAGVGGADAVTVRPHDELDRRRGIADRSPPRPEYAARAHRGVQPRSSRRPRRRCVVRRAPHRPAGQGGVGSVPGPRTGGRQSSRRCAPGWCRSAWPECVMPGPTPLPIGATR